MRMMTKEVFERPKAQGQSKARRALNPHFENVLLHLPSFVSVGKRKTRLKETSDKMLKQRRGSLFALLC